MTDPAGHRTLPADVDNNATPSAAAIRPRAPNVRRSRCPQRTGIIPDCRVIERRLQDAVDGIQRPDRLRPRATHERPESADRCSARLRRQATNAAGSPLAEGIPLQPGVRTTLYGPLLATRTGIGFTEIVATGGYGSTAL